MSIRIKGQPLKDWEDWTKNELTPPHNLTGIHLYITEALHEAVTHLRRVEQGKPIIGYKHRPKPRLKIIKRD